MVLVCGPAVKTVITHNYHESSQLWLEKTSHPPSAIGPETDSLDWCLYVQHCSALVSTAQATRGCRGVKSKHWSQHLVTQGN